MNDLTRLIDLPARLNWPLSPLFLQFFVFCSWGQSHLLNYYVQIYLLTYHMHGTMGCMEIDDEMDDWVM